MVQVGKSLFKQLSGERNLLLLMDNPEGILRVITLSVSKESFQHEEKLG